MSGLELHLESATSRDCIEQVTSFAAEDASGCFGILPGHERMVTVVEFGMSRFRVRGGDWRYIAAPGAVIYLHDDELHFCTRRYALGDDVASLRDVLESQLRAEERELQEVKKSLKGLEEQMLRRLWQLGRSQEELS